MLTSLIVFAVVGLITPGPNNILLMNSGVNFGYRKTLPHILGIALGFSFMLFMVGVGISKVFLTYPIVEKVLQVICGVYLVYLSYKIITMPAIGDSHQKNKRPMTLIEAAAFQWVNPKGWTLALTATSMFASLDVERVSLFMALIFFCINLVTTSIWVISGVQIKNFLSSPVNLRRLNTFMGCLLLSTLIFMF